MVDMYCLCCEEWVNERTERRHHALQAPIATIASSPYLAAYTQRNRLAPPSKMKTKSKNKPGKYVLRAPSVEPSAEAAQHNTPPPIPPPPEDVEPIEAIEDFDESNILNAQDVLEDIVDQSEIAKSWAREDTISPDSESEANHDNDSSPPSSGDELSEDEEESMDEDEGEEELDVWDIIDEMIIQEAASACMSF
jgi:hypothetical protein